jgi:hypothetical protein
MSPLVRASIEVESWTAMNDFVDTAAETAGTAPTSENIGGIGIEAASRWNAETRGNLPAFSTPPGVGTTGKGAKGANPLSVPANGGGYEKGGQKRQKGQ